MENRSRTRSLLSTLVAHIGVSCFKVVKRKERVGNLSSSVVSPGNLWPRSLLVFHGSTLSAEVGGCTDFIEELAWPDAKSYV